MNMKWLAIGTAILLLLAIPSGLWPYGYYIFLRWIVCVSSVIISYSFYESKLSGWAFTFGGIALLFNPIAPVYLDKSSWVMIDFVTAALLFISTYSIKEKS